MHATGEEGRDQPRRTRRGTERDVLLRARARELFLSRGYDGVSVDEIVRDVGGSKTNVYSFYSGKDGLFVTIMDELIKELVQPLREIDLGDLSLEQGLRKFAQTLLDILLTDGHLAFQRLVVAEALRHPEIAQSWYRNGPACTHAVLREFLEEQQKLRRVRPDADVASIATLFHDMVVCDLLSRAMMAVEGGPQPREVQATIGRAIDIIVAASGLPGESDGGERGA
jgi:AcrR family transcriptional regulator